MRAKLTGAVVRELLNYDPKTGVLVWKKRARKWFKSERGWKIWNTRYAGRRAFTARMKRGSGDCHLEGTILYHVCYAHQVIWLWMTNHWPRMTGHVNGRGTDNRWDNLCEVTRSQNQRNMHRRRNSQKQYANIEKRSTSSYRVHLRGVGYLGPFRTLSAAITARDKAKKMHGYTELHGTRRAA